MIKLHASSLQFIRKETLAQMFPMNFAKFLKNSFFVELRLLLEMDAQKRVINVIKRPIDIDIKYLHL